VPFRNVNLLSATLHCFFGLRSVKYRIFVYLVKHSAIKLLRGPTLRNGAHHRCCPVRSQEGRGVFACAVRRPSSSCAWAAATQADLRAAAARPTAQGNGRQQRPTAAETTGSGDLDPRFPAPAEAAVEAAHDARGAAQAEEPFQMPPQTPDWIREPISAAAP
jgi:hypothetical protein